MSTKRKRVGIDLAPVSISYRALGTARLVKEEVKALFRLNVPWEWVPTVESSKNPLWAETQAFGSLIVPGERISFRATFKVGSAWQEAGCQLGFATAYFVPWKGIPVVANFFDSNIYEYGDTWIKSGRRLNYYLLRALSTYAIYRAEHLFVCSNYCAGVLKRLFPRDAHKFVVVPIAAYNRQPCSESPPAWARQLTKPYFLFAGSFSENKNQRRLIEAWALLQKEHDDLPCLVLIGPCDPYYRTAKIDPALTTCPRPDEILLPGMVPLKEVAWLYTHAVGYIQPSIAEGFGMPVVEAMQYEIPVASSNTTSLPETCGDAAVFFDPFSTEDIARTVERLWKDEGLRKSLIEKGRKRCEAFSWAQTAEKIASVIDSTLSRLNATGRLT